MNKEEIKMREMLMKMGISANLKGFRVILDAIEILKTQQIHTNITTIYDFIGKKEGSSSSDIERAIRYSITRAYINGNILRKMYKRKPNNSAFLYDLVFNFDVFENLEV